MKAKWIKRSLGLRSKSVSVALFILLMAACHEGNIDILDSTDTQNVNSETVSSSLVSENSDISANMINGLSTTQYAGGRADGDLIPDPSKCDFRLKCATVTVTRTGTKENPAGTITITFNPDCTDSHNVKRSGTIVISFAGKRWMPGSYHSVHLIDFYRNGVHIEGTDSLRTELSADSLHLQFHSMLINGKVTFTDGKTITRDHDLTREWIRASLPVNDEWLVLKGGTASGTNKNGNSYQMQITKDLVHKVSCEINEKVVIPVSGTKDVTVTSSKGTKQYTVDFGDGTCDNVITVTINGKVKSITVDSGGN